MSLIHPDQAACKATGLDEERNVCLPEHCFHAFNALDCALTSAPSLTATFDDDEYPLFVTWNIRSSRAGRAPQLRGCIGTFEPLAVRDGIAEYALVSAFRDSRFRKITKSELPNLECGISLLTDFEDAASYLDWTVGTHGIWITFPHPSSLPSSATSSSEAPSPFSSSPYLPRMTSKQTFSATYLPDVMPDQGWDKIEAVDSAIRKAGWNGLITEDLRRCIKLRRYQSRKCTVSWDDYVQWKSNKLQGT
ncbi:hypothetical protein APHAL10511_002050 [Amanita phalloides]|nr:hypothetical protein APHAL10511_002050 [Amanita phalloides]